MWYYSVSFDELNGVSPFKTDGGLFMDQINFWLTGISPAGRARIFITEDGVILTEDEVCKVMTSVGCFDCSEDINLLTPMELKEILSGDRYSLY